MALRAVLALQVAWIGFIGLFTRGHLPAIESLLSAGPPRWPGLLLKVVLLLGVVGFPVLAVVAFGRRPPASHLRWAIPALAVGLLLAYVVALLPAAQ